MREILSWTKIWLAAFVLAALGSGVANAQPVKTGHAEASLISERSTVSPGDTFLGALKLDLEEDGWHVYWKNPGDSGLPPTVVWTLPEGVTASEFKWPAPHAIRLTPQLMNHGYEHQVVFPIEFRIPATAKPGEQITLKGKFDWLICQDVCVPEGAELSLTLPVGTAPVSDEAGGKEIGEALVTAARPLSGKATIERTTNGFKVSAIDSDLAASAKTAKTIHFFPEGPEIVNAAEQKIRVGDAGVSAELVASEYAKPGDQPLPGIFVTEAPDGAMRSWAVVPTSGVTPAGVADQEFGGGKAALGLSELGLTLVFAFLGGLVLNLMPCVLPVLTIKAAGLVHTAHNPKESRAHGLAYLGGVLVCFAVIGAILVGLRAAGDQAGLGFQLQYPWVTALFSLVMFAVGLNLLGVFEIGGSLMGVGGRFADKGGVSGAFFTGLLAAFVGAPCVGPFMAPAVGVALDQPAPVVMAVFLVIGLGLAAPFVLLSFTPAFAKVLPKPGKWMATFRQALAFPMFLTVLWLLWVLAGQAGSDGVIIVAGGAIALAFGIWLANKIGSNVFGRILAGLVILSAFVVPAVATATASAPISPTNARVEANAWSNEKVAQLRAEGRVIFVDFTARWCVTCQMNKGAINDAKVQKVFADLNVAFLEADWTNKDSVIAAALAEHGRAGVPLYLVYPATGGEPVILDQLLSPGMIEKAVRDAAGTI